MPDERGQFRSIQTPAGNTAAAIDVRPFLFHKADAGEIVVLVTLYCAHGGGWLRPGAQMAVTIDQTSGALFGNAIDADIIRHAHKALIDGKPHWLAYGEDTGLQPGDGIHVALLVERVLPNDPALHCLREKTAEGGETLWLSDGHDRSCMASMGCKTADNAGELPDGAIWVRYRP